MAVLMISTFFKFYFSFLKNALVESLLGSFSQNRGSKCKLPHHNEHKAHSVNWFWSWGSAAFERLWLFRTAFSSDQPQPLQRILPLSPQRSMRERLCQLVVPLLRTLWVSSINRVWSYNNSLGLVIVILYDFWARFIYYSSFLTILIWVLQLSSIV